MTDEKKRKDLKKYNKTIEGREVKKKNEKKSP